MTMLLVMIWAVCASYFIGDIILDYCDKKRREFLDMQAKILVCQQDIVELQRKVEWLKENTVRKEYG